MCQGRAMGVLESCFGAGIFEAWFSSSSVCVGSIVALMLFMVQSCGWFHEEGGRLC